jgi:hypothetical protein
VTTHYCMKLSARIGRAEGVKWEGAPPAETSESEDEADEADRENLQDGSRQHCLRLRSSVHTVMPRGS